ncbi:MAG: DUF433 domain-containing protein [Cyclobacteriaceae bacterium]|nr:DUF433 domain-containing protein [Cyclobacteriaceae bacterium]
MEKYLDHITIDKEIRFGKPTIKGTRIAVSDVLQWFASGMTEEKILEDYPYLSKEQIRAALLFAAHKEELTKIIAA